MSVPLRMRDGGLRQRAAAYGVDPATLAHMEQNSEWPEPSGIYVGSAPAGEEVGLPILFSGADYLNINFPGGGAAGATGAISGETPPNNYAVLQVTALQVGLTHMGESQTNMKTEADDVALITVLTSLTPEGGLNGFYGNQSVNVSGFQTGGDGFRRIVKRITGLRENCILRMNRTMTLTGIVYQALANTYDIDVMIEAQVLCRVLGDDELRRRGL